MTTPRPIGIVACSAEGAALCYRTICTEAPGVLGGHAHPEVALHSHDFGAYMERIYAGDWAGVGEIMLDSANKLAGLGAAVLVCPDNTIHQALPFIAGRAPVPWLHIAEVVAEDAAARGFRRIGITGTRWLVESEVYPEKLAARGLAFLRPEPDEREAINRIIMDELVCGVFPGRNRSPISRRVIGRMKGEGCDAVVLGCTEIPLIMDESNSPLPVLDSTRLLARAALRWSVG